LLRIPSEIVGDNVSKKKIEKKKKLKRHFFLVVAAAAKMPASIDTLTV
jgi:hypothetical protein